MKNTLIDPALVKRSMESLYIDDLNKASIRQMGGIVRHIEQESGTEFIHFEMGVPGFAPSAIGTAAEKKALEDGIPSVYPPMEGIPALKTETARFFRAFLDTEISPEGCIPTVGSMQGAYASMMLCTQLDPKKDTILFIDPGFSVQKTQTKVIGIKSVAFDLYHFRDEKFAPKLEEYLKAGNIAAVIYSNPNNPTWMCLCEAELKVIGEMCTKYDVIVLEDLAYMAMDFRTELGIPFQAPYQPTVSHYTDNYVILMSASKIFSYAGQRIAMIGISDKLFNRDYPVLKERYGVSKFGQSMIQNILYCLSSGTAHTPQYALAAMLKAANDGSYNFVEDMKEYGRRSAKLKEVFLRNGFNIIYDKDIDQPVGDGFFFTVGYKGMEGGELLLRLLHYGVNAIVLSTTGSQQQGLRISASAVKPHHYRLLDERLRMFTENN